MTNNIPGIGINTSGVNPYIGQPSNDGTKPEDNAPDTKQSEASNVQVNPNDVLSIMAQQAVLTVPSVTPTTYDVNKYVTPEQAARIAGFISSFEDKVAAALTVIEAEFGDTLSDEAKYALAAGMA